MAADPAVLVISRSPTADDGTDILSGLLADCKEVIWCLTSTIWHSREPSAASSKSWRTAASKSSCSFSNTFLSVKARAITSEEKEKSAFKILRKARTDKKYDGAKKKKAAAKAEEALK